MVDSMVTADGRRPITMDMEKEKENDGPSKKRWTIKQNTDPFFLSRHHPSRHRHQTKTQAINHHAIAITIKCSPSARFCP